MQTFNRRQFIGLSAAGMACTFPSIPLAGQEKSVKGDVDLQWHDVTQTGVEGKGWNDTERFFDRLPLRAKSKVRAEVWNLSRHAAGMLFRFRTNARTLSAKYSLLSDRLAMPHMPATGVSGLDFYARDETDRDSWLAVTQPAAKDFNAVVARDIDPLPTDQLRLFAVYLPLYNGVESLHIGVPKDAKFELLAPRREPAIVFYGTSIMHGACASRPGMSISGIVGRRLDCPTINLGFSGNGRMEPEVGEFISELDARVFAIDCLPNMNGQQVAERAVPLVKQLKQARPKTPIVLVEDRAFTNSRFQKSRRDHHAASRDALRNAYESLRASGIDGLSYLSGDELLGDDGEAATDGSHPNDLGMMRYADAYEQVLSGLMNGV